MKKRPWLTLYMLLALSMGILGTTPLGATAQESHSWDVYETTMIDINYHNLTHITVKHPVSGSLVAENQKLNFIVVPFDIDDYFYSVKIYKNDILMYTCNQEIVYDINIYTTNPINQIVTVTFTLNDQEVLKLEYIAILTEVSLDQDFTEQWLAYQAQKKNESMTGAELVSRKDLAMRNMSMVGTTGFWSLILALVAIFFVLYFQIIKIVNLFSAIVWFLSGFMWLSNMNQIDEWMRSLSVVTPDDVFVYYANIITITLIILIANLFFIITYKATSTRLERKDFYAFDKKNRTLTKFPAVIGRKRSNGKICWRLQDSFSALRRVLFRADYEIEYDRGNINDTYRLVRARTKPENIDIRRPLKMFARGQKEIFGRLTFYTKPLPEQNNNESLGNPGKKNKKKTKKPKKGPKKPEEIKKKFIDMDIWKLNQSTSPLINPTPVVFIDGVPEFRREFKKEDYDSIIDKMKQTARETSDPKILRKLQKKIEKRTKALKKELKNPERFVVDMNLANAEVYDLVDWVTDTKTFEHQAKLINKYRDEVHKLQRELLVKGYEAGEDIYTGFDKTLSEWEKGNIEGDIR